MEKINKKSKILLSAVKIFAKKGFELTSVDDIALKADVAKGTIYYYFKSKDEIFEAILTQGKEMFDRAIELSIVDVDNFEDRIEKIIEAERQMIEKYKDFFVIFTGQLLKKATRFELIEKVLQEGINTGNVRNNIDVQMVSMSIFWMVAMTTVSGKIKDQKEMILNGIGS